MKLFLLLFLIYPCLSFSQQNYPYKNLVLEGGGIRGLAYPGALKVLEEKGIIKNIRRIAGTSAGAITALMIALDYNSHEIDSILQTLKIQKFNDGKNIFGKIGRVKKEFGIFKGEQYEKWLGELIQHKTGNTFLTFLQLHSLHANNANFKDVFCTGTNISKQRLQVFSWQQTPGMLIRTAIHISGCIPIYFKPVAIDSNWAEVPVKKNAGLYDLYVDGGMLANYPINIFDSCLHGGDPLLCDQVKFNPETLGLKLERSDQIEQFSRHQTAIAPFNIHSESQYITALMNLLMETLNRKTPSLENEAGRTIYISYENLSGRPRKISAETKKLLFDNGFNAAQKFFNGMYNSSAR